MSELTEFRAAKDEFFASHPKATQETELGQSAGLLAGRPGGPAGAVAGLTTD